MRVILSILADDFYEFNRTKDERIIYLIRHASTSFSSKSFLFSKIEGNDSKAGYVIIFRPLLVQFLRKRLMRRNNNRNRFNGRDWDI